MQQSDTCILLPQPLSNDPRFIQCIYRYSHASKRFVEVKHEANLPVYYTTHSVEHNTMQLENGGLQMLCLQ